MHEALDGGVKEIILIIAKLNLKESRKILRNESWGRGRRWGLEQETKVFKSCITVLYYTHL